MNIAEATVNADVARELLLEADLARSDFDAYIYSEGIRRPNGTTREQWREDLIGCLVADALVRLERAVTLLGGTS